MPTDEFLVPFGLADDGRLVARDAVEKGHRYRCPECESNLIVKAGDVRRRYLAHEANTACEPESLAHKTAKLLVAQVVNDWKGGHGEVPMVERACPSCTVLWRAPLPARISAAAVEVSVNGRWRVDVGLTQGDQVVAAVEIFHTHKTGGEKADDITIPWTELRAAAVIEEPLVWRPVGGTKSGKACPTCEKGAADRREQEARRREALVKLGKSLNQPVLDGAFGTSSQRCWKCHKETLVYRWDGQPWAKQAPSQKPPRTVKFVFSKTVNHKYWANTCGACDALQGDHFMFNEPTGAFYGGAFVAPVVQRSWGEDRTGEAAVQAFLNRALGR